MQAEEGSEMGIVKATVPSTGAEEGVIQASDIHAEHVRTTNRASLFKSLQCDSSAPLTRWVFLWPEAIISLKSHGNVSSFSR